MVKTILSSVTRNSMSKYTIRCNLHFSIRSYLPIYSVVPKYCLYKISGYILSFLDKLFYFNLSFEI